MSRARQAAAAVFGGRPDLGHVVLFAAVAVFAFVPLAAVLVRVAVEGGTPSGVDGPGHLDQLQYIAWVRDSGEHGLISNRFRLESDPHVYLHPLWLVSGLLWKLGLSVQAAWLVWKPVTVVLLFAAFAAYARRLLRDTFRAVCAAAIALFFFPPLTPLADWTGAFEAGDRFWLELFGFEVYPGNYLWGHPSTGIAVAMMPLAFLWIERALEPDSRSRRHAIAAAAAGALASWVHPWQGAVILAVLGTVALTTRGRRSWTILAAPAAATLAPLLYYLALSRSDTDWSTGYDVASGSHHLGWLALAVGPLAALAVAGALRGDETGGLQERIVRIWPLATLAVYVVMNESFFYNVLSGISLPLAVLAVRAVPAARGWRWGTVALVALMTLPGLVHVLDGFRDSVRRDEGPYWLEPGERRALEYLDARPGGGVLSRVYLGGAMPAFTSLSTWVGHPSWTPDHRDRVNAAEDLMEEGLAPRDARRLVLRSGAAYVLTDCSLRPDLERVLGEGVARTRRFDCAAVYEIDRAGLERAAAR